MGRSGPGKRSVAVDLVNNVAVEGVVSPEMGTSHSLTGFGLPRGWSTLWRAPGRDPQQSRRAERQRREQPDPWEKRRPIEESQATIAGAINSASLFFGVFTRLLTGVATMWVSGYCLNNLNASSGGAVSHPSRSSLARIAGMRCLTL
jgi:hypothetical protein